jgi:hypothetical protein
LVHLPSLSIGAHRAEMIEAMRLPLVVLHVSAGTVAMLAGALAIELPARAREVIDAPEMCSSCAC